MNARLHAMPSQGHSAARGKAAPVHTCLECGAPAPRSQHFCSAACRRDFHNRRRVRGAALYDLYMASRFDRAASNEAGLWKLMNRLASAWREEDQAKRGGRRSYLGHKEALDRMPWLHATTVVRGRGHRSTPSAPRASGRADQATLPAME